MKPIIVKVLLALCIFFSIILVILSLETKYEVEQVNVSENDLDNWSLENSVLNGASLLENKNIYKEENPGEITKLYVTVFPTEEESGNVLDFSAFDLHSALNKEYNPELNANVVFGDADGNLSQVANTDIVNASIRVRGNSSRGATFKSYKINLKNESMAFYGQSVLNLNKHPNDIIKVTNKFSMDMMQPIENMVGFRTNFMLVYIRDASLPEEEQEYKYYGLFTHIEQPNKTFLRVRGLDENASLYKAENFEFRVSEELKNIDDPEYDEALFETVLEIREGNNHEKLLKMLEDVNDMNQDFSQVFSTYFNEDNYLTWLACNILLGNEDTIAHNFILYNPLNSMTWYMLPWDYDGTFQFGKYESSYSAPDSLKGIQRLTGVMLHRRYFRIEGNLNKLTNKIQELRETAFTKERVDSLIAQYKPVLEETMTSYPDVLLTYMPPNEMNGYLDQFYEQIEENYEEYLSSIEYPMPMFVSEPVKNADGSTYFAWEPSYDIQGELITYGITLARDYERKDIVFAEDNLAETNYTFTKTLPSGTYYLAITATDQSGNTQYSLDHYRYRENSIYKFGVREVVLE
ncbi:MAG: putative rane protein [Lachnospiraceae bacterium]|jgi:spore coat protein H|nr:putative rane protein [Lachnospiraceae bacterium]